jgi:hypothetical protein
MCCAARASTVRWASSATIRGRVMDVKARPLGKPPFDQRRFVRAVVVHDDVHVEVPGDACVDQVEKLTELRRPVSLMEMRDDLTGLRVERREQGGRVVPCVIVRPALDLAGCNGSKGCVRSSA